MTAEPEPLAERLAYWRANGAPGRIRAAPRERIVTDERTGEKTRHRAVLHDHTGDRVGRHIDHGDGRTDGTVEKPTVIARPGLRIERKDLG
jgi:hypothetical protein